MKKSILLAITIIFLTTSCAMSPVMAGESTAKVIEAKNLSLELYILNASIQEKVAELKKIQQPRIDEINKLQNELKAKKAQLDKLLGKTKKTKNR